MSAKPDKTRSHFRAAAEQYIERNWRVHPLGVRSKRPATSRGKDDATTDAGQVKDWWSKTPKANIGVSCDVSGLLVLDIDPRDGGEEAFARLIKKHGELPPTLEVDT